MVRKTNGVAALGLSPIQSEDKACFLSITQNQNSGENVWEASVTEKEL